ncbi:MAG: recombinase family protein [Hyphomicrobiaceae bacterium]
MAHSTNRPDRTAIGRYIGYARERNGLMSCDMQVAALEDAGVLSDSIYQDVQVTLEAPNGSRRPGLCMALKEAVAGDTLVAWDLLTIANSLQRAGEVLEELRARAVCVWFLKDDLDTRSELGDTFVQVLCATARVRRQERSADTCAGLARARARGRKGGRPNALDDAKTQEARSLIERGVAMAGIARQLGVSRATLYNAGLAARPARKGQERKK